MTQWNTKAEAHNSCELYIKYTSHCASYELPISPCLSFILILSEDNGTAWYEVKYNQICRSNWLKQTNKSLPNSHVQHVQTSGTSCTRRLVQLCKGRYTLWVKMGGFTVWRHAWLKKWGKCAVLTGNSAGLTTVLFSRLSHTILRSSLRESHSFLSLPADTTMASSQGISFFSNSFSRWKSHDIFLFKYHLLLHILRFIFFFSDNIMADMASKQQTTALYLCTTVTRTRRHTKNWQAWWETCAVPENIHFSSPAVFLHS